MGITSSSIPASQTDSSERSDIVFPEDLLVDILSFVPAKDLLTNCILVCHQWKNVISSHAVWKQKCIREGKVIPPYVFGNIPQNYYRKIYIRNPYGRNLLANPCGKGELDKWEIIENSGDGWRVEDPPAGADAVPEEVGETSCFATSYGRCSKCQEIDLMYEGVAPEVMDNVQPKISVSEWHAARFDCGSIYKLKVLLLDENRSVVIKFKSGELREEQWVGRAWSKYSRVFDDYPPGIRYIVFIHTGVDTQFWAGHYGSKMTGACVKFKWK